MYEIVENTVIAPNIRKIRIKSPEIASKREPGQFVIIMSSERGERIPLTIVDSDEKTITVIVQIVGASTSEIASFEKGSSFFSVAGPLGKPTHIENYGNIAVVGGGVGIAPLYPITKKLKEAGNKITAILGGRSKEYIILLDEIRSVSDEIVCTTDDGSFGVKGLVTYPLEDMLKSGGVDFVFTVGPVVMMEAVSDLTKRYGVKTMASLNPIMVDGTGMCGACRCNVGGETKFACVDGPEFDAHLIDFKNLRRRLNMFREEENLAKKDIL